MGTACGMLGPRSGGETGCILHAELCMSSFSRVWWSEVVAYFFLQLQILGI